MQAQQQPRSQGLSVKNPGNEVGATESWIPLPYQHQVTLFALSFNLLATTTLGCSSKQKTEIILLNF